MPYRVDIQDPSAGALDLLLELGALDVEAVNGGLAAIMPDGVTSNVLAGALGVDNLPVSDAVTRDSGSVWLVSPPAAPHALRLIDSSAFGTGQHATTALCLEAMEATLRIEPVDSVLDVGTGSGILALAALMLGVPRAVGLDIDADALRIAAENARLNDVAARLQLILGGPEAVDGHWPLVVANVLAAPLMDIAPALVRKMARGGRLILSGISRSLEPDVKRAYQRLGIDRMTSTTRGGWTAIVAQAPW